MFFLLFFSVHLVLLHPYPLIGLQSIPQNDKVKVYKEKHKKPRLEHFEKHLINKFFLQDMAKNLMIPQIGLQRSSAVAGVV